MTMTTFPTKQCDDLDIHGPHLWILPSTTAVITRAYCEGVEAQQNVKITGVYHYLQEGWWHPNVVSGKVHDHTSRTIQAHHRLCEPVYTKRPGVPR